MKFKHHTLFNIDFVSSVIFLDLANQIDYNVANVKKAEKNLIQGVRNQFQERMQM